jgi:hypothetical protein
MFQKTKRMFDVGKPDGMPARDTSRGRDKIHAQRRSARPCGQRNLVQTVAINPFRGQFAFASRHADLAPD